MHFIYFFLLINIRKSELINYYDYLHLPKWRNYKYICQANSSIRSEYYSHSYISFYDYNLKYIENKTND